MNFDPNILLSNNYVVIDFETTNKDKGHARNKDNRLLMLSLRGPQIQNKTFIVSEYKLYEILAPIIDSMDFIVAHNAKFELQWMARAGFELHKLPPVWCTQVAEYVIFGNIKVPLSLEECCKRRGIPAKENYVSTLIKAGVCPSEIQEGMLAKYCAHDVRITEQLFLKQREEIQKLGLLPVAYTEFMYIPVIADLEMVGLHLDKEKVTEEYEASTFELTTIEKELDEITGGINMSSPKQVGEFLYDTLKFKELKDRYGNVCRTPAGGRLTDANTIEKLVASTKKQKRFKELKLEYAKLTKKISTYLEPYMEACKGDGIIYGSYNQTVTRNHRLSSSNPNLQNQPREYKALFSARKKGYKYVKADYSQLEFRAAAFLGKDKQAYKDIKEQVDVHSYTASIIGCSRQEAKAHTFKPLYGGRSGTDAERRYYKAFREKYYGITSTQEGWKLALLKQQGTESLTLPNGMRFYWTGTEMQRSGYITNSTTICNYPVSYLATASSGISGIGTMLVWRALKANDLKSFMVSVTHDDVGLEVCDEEEEVVKNILTRRMIDGTIEYMRKVYNVDFDVPLDIEINVIN